VTTWAARVWRRLRREQLLSVNINDESAVILARVMARNRLSKKEATRRAIAWLGLVEQVRRDGGRIHIEERDA
jgi:hypothetical protein